MKPCELTYRLLGWFLLVLVFMTAAPVQGQIENHLILKKRGYMNKMHFLAGDPITFIRSGSRIPEEALIQGIGRDYIIVSGQALPVGQIAAIVRHRTGFNFKASGGAVMAAGPGYLLVGLINSLFAGTSLWPTWQNLVVAGTLVAIGAVIPGFQERTYKLGDTFSLSIVQSDPFLLHK